MESNTLAETFELNTEDLIKAAIENGEGADLIFTPQVPQSEMSILWAGNVDTDPEDELAILTNNGGMYLIDNGLLGMGILNDNSIGVRSESASADVRKLYKNNLHVTGDYNGDGYDDFALSGLNNSGDLITYVAENNINTFIVAHILQGTYYGKPSWGDYDNDGDLDLLVTGQSSTQGDLGSSPITHIYKQIDNQFQLDQTVSIDSVGISFSQWGDYDVDGDLDLFLSGFKENQEDFP